MYITERIIGVSTYLFVTLVAFILIRKGRISFKKVLFFYLITTTILAFFYIPPKGEDLFRINLLMDSINKSNSTYDISYFFNTSYPLGYLLYFIIAKTSIYGLLPAIANIVTYGNLFYILESTSRQNKNTAKENGFLFVFIISAGMFGCLISNIRSLLALSIVTRCIYDESINNKKLLKNILLYAAAMLIHPLSIALIASWFLYQFISKDKKITKIIAIIIISCLVYFGFRFLIDTAISKFFHYSEENTYFSLVDFIKVTTIDVLIYYLIMITNNKLIKDNEARAYDLNKYITLVLILLVLLHEYNVFIRISYMLPILFLPTLSYLLKNIHKYKYKRTLLFILFIILAVPLILSCTRGHLSSFKFILLN